MNNPKNSLNTKAEPLLHKLMHTVYNTINKDTSQYCNWSMYLILYLHQEDIHETSCMLVAFKLDLYIIPRVYSHL